MNSLRKWQYVSYQVDQTEVLVAGCAIEGTHEIDPGLSFNGCLALTENLIPNFNCELQWSPWDESENVPNEVLLSSMLILDRWINVQKRKRIVIHCHNGTHRAPSIFGFFIKTYFSEVVNQIINSATPSDPNGVWGWKDPTDKETWYTNPLEKANYKIEKFPDLAIKLSAIKDGSGNRLDNLNKIAIPFESLSLEDQENTLKRQREEDLLKQASRVLHNYGYIFDGKNLTHPDFKVMEFVLVDSKSEIIFPQNFIFHLYHDFNKILIVESKVTVDSNFLKDLTLLENTSEMAIYTYGPKDVK